MITTKTLYLDFKAQVTASQQNIQILSDGIPGMAAMGFKQEALKVDNAYVIYDSSCPANNVLCLNLESHNFRIKPGKNLTVSSFIDLSRYSEGAKEADQAFIETEFIYSIDNPYLQVKYTAIGT